LQYQYTLYKAEKYIGYYYVGDITRLSSFVHTLDVVASQNREISTKFGPYNSSRSSKDIDVGVNRKLICDFLLVINCNFGHICYRFEISTS